MYVCTYISMYIYIYVCRRMYIMKKNKQQPNNLAYNDPIQSLVIDRTQWTVEAFDASAAELSSFRRSVAPRAWANVFGSFGVLNKDGTIWLFNIAMENPHKWRFLMRKSSVNGPWLP